MMRRMWQRRVRGLLVGVTLLLDGVFAMAQVPRDPTVPPPELPAGPSGPMASASPLGKEGVAVVVRDGKPFLVVGTRLYAPGQMVNAYRLVRITETEVWLREGKQLHKIPRFSGIERSEVKAAPPCETVIPSPAKRIDKNKKNKVGNNPTAAAPAASCDDAIL